MLLYPNGVVVVLFFFKGLLEYNFSFESQVSVEKKSKIIVLSFQYFDIEGFAYESFHQRSFGFGHLEVDVLVVDLFFFSHALPNL